MTLKIGDVRTTGNYRQVKVKCTCCGNDLMRRAYRAKGHNYCNGRCQMTYEYANGIRDPKKMMVKFHSIGRELLKQGKHPIQQKESRDTLRALMKTKEYRDKLKGENNYNWKGGVNTLYGAIRSCFEYRQWRSDVFARDSFTCQKCGDNRGGNLISHHKKAFIKILQYYEITTLEQALRCEELWSINNGITLYKDCHREVHRKVAPCYN